MISTMSLMALLAIAAPVPKGAAADAAVVAPTGPPPILAYLKADATGDVYIQMTRVVPIQIVQNGKAVTDFVTVQEGFTIRSLKFAITTPSGEKVDEEEAYKRLRTGGYVAVSRDGKAVSPGYLRTLNRDVLILASPAFVPRPEPMMKE